MTNTLRWLQTLALLGLALAAIPITANQCSERQSRQQALAQAGTRAQLGTQAAETGDWHLSAQAYADALGTDPHNADFRDALRRAHVEQIIGDAGLLSGANALQLQLELQETGDTTTPRQRLALGRILQFRGHGELAIVEFREAAKAAPTLALAQLFLGDALLKQKSYKEASVALTKALELNKDLALASFALGQVKVIEKKDAEAIKLLKTASERLNNGKVFLALGAAYARERRWEDAARALERTLALDGSLSAAYRPLADAYVQSKQFQAAVGAYKMAYEHTADLQSLRALGRLYRQLEMHREAGESFNQLRALVPSDPEAHCQIAISADVAGEFELALNAYTTCVKLSEGQAELKALNDQATSRLQLLQQIKAKQLKDGETKR